MGYTPEGASPYPMVVDPMLTQWGLEHCEESNLQQFGQQHSGFVNLSDIEHTASDRAVGGSASGDFRDFWNMQSDVQKFPEQRE
jgi:hypothetical protein